MNTQRIVRALAVVLIAWTLSASADETLSLTDAVERAVKASPDIDALTAARDAAHLRIGPAGELPDPELVIGVDNLPITGADAGSVTRDFMTMRKVGVMQSIPGHAKRALRSQRAADAEKLAEAETLQTALDVKRQAAEAWIATYVAEETLKRLRALQEDFELQVNAANAGVKSGRVTVADALVAQTARLTLKDRVYVAEQNVQRARAELARWLPQDAQCSLASPPNFAHLPKEELLQNIHHHASLLAYDAQLDAARSEFELAKLEKRPDVSVGVTYAKRGPDFSDMVSIEVRVGLPLFAGKRQDPFIAAKHAELRKVEAQREAQLRMHTADVKQMIADWATLTKRVTAFNTELLPLSKARAQLAITSYQSGRGDLKSTLNEQLNFLELQLQCLEIQGQLGRTWASLNYLQDDRSEQ